MSTNDIVYIFVVLILLLASVYVVLYFMKKMMFRFEGSGGNKIPITVVAVKGILPKRYVTVVKVLDSYYVLGVSDTNITLLDKANAEAIKDYDSLQSSEVNMKFGDFLKKSLKKK